MTSEQFAYWLQGFAELNEQPPSAQQWQMVRDHLALVFNKVTPFVHPYGAGGARTDGAWLNTPRHQAPATADTRTIC